MIQRLIYSSEHALETPVVRDLVSRAAENNRRRGVTGLLVGDRHCFIQALEGERSVVSALFHTITRDPRHREVQLVDICDVSEKSYPDWGMTQLDDVARVSALWWRLGAARPLYPPTMTAAQIKDLLRLVAFELLSSAAPSVAR
jgi:hypothetical protein